jgi:hypothetical protein
VAPQLPPSLAGVEVRARTALPPLDCITLAVPPWARADGGWNPAMPVVPVVAGALAFPWNSSGWGCAPSSPLLWSGLSSVPASVSAAVPGVVVDVVGVVGGVPGVVEPGSVSSVSSAGACRVAAAPDSSPDGGGATSCATASFPLTSSVSTGGPNGVSSDASVAESKADRSSTSITISPVSAFRCDGTGTPLRSQPAGGGSSSAQSGSAATTIRDG